MIARISAGPRLAAALLLSLWCALAAGAVMAQGIAPAVGGLFGTTESTGTEEAAAPEAVPPDPPAASVEETLSPEVVLPDEGETTGDEADATEEVEAETTLTPATAYAAPDTALPGTGPLAAVLAENGVNWESWERTAARSESLSQRGQGSDFALQRLRGDLVVWRDRFQLARGANSSRIGTVEAQLTALGAAPEGGGEDGSIAERRAALTERLMQLRAPVRLADEAYAHADGLIREIDRLIRERRGRALGDRGVSPLNPGLWPAALVVMYERAAALRAELWA
ncbi:DUF3772 domain-containing protein, partial [Limimaricola sp. ASW11-118]